MIELHDTEVIDAGAESMSDVSENGLVPHFIYCGDHYLYTYESRSLLWNILLTKMRSYGVQSAILTMLDMYRGKLITKEKVKKAYQGKLKKGSIKHAVSINDDLENFFVNLQNQKQIKGETVYSFFTPKLTDKEMKLVEQRNKRHLDTYWKHYKGHNPDVNDEEMKKSDSKSKYVQGLCARDTRVLTLESNEKETTENDLSDTKKKCIIM